MDAIGRRAILAGLVALSAADAAAQTLAGQTVDPLLQAAIDDPRRSPADRARDIYRHPGQSLTFWGLKRGDTVIDIGPGPGWWTQIIAPYLAATHGRYIAALPDLGDPALSQAARNSRAGFEAKFSSHADYGDLTQVSFGRVSGPLTPPNTADLVLVSREVHDWAQIDGFVQKALADFRAALKPGGVLAIEDHRARDGADPKKGDGYLSEAFVITEAGKAGFALAGRSEINANPKDTKDYPFGVWTLPPTRRSAPVGQPPDPSFDHARYDAIGESDRMTLKFVKRM